MSDLTNAEQAITWVTCDEDRIAEVVRLAKTEPGLLELKEGLIRGTFYICSAEWATRPPDLGGGVIARVVLRQVLTTISQEGGEIK